MKTLRALLCAVTLLVGLAHAQTYTFTSANYYGTGGGIAPDGSGGYYITNYYNATLAHVLSSGGLTTIAGQSYSSGSADGSGLLARFSSPAGLAIDAAGNFYVADQGNHAIRKVTARGDVTTLAGTLGQRGAADGAGALARFARPSGLAIDAAGNLYVADTENAAIRKITPAGTVTTLAGQLGSTGFADGAGASARFNSPNGVAVDTSGNVYVADTGNHVVRKISATGTVTTLAGLPGNSGTTDGTGNQARFASPLGVAVDNAGNVFVGDTGNYTLRRITPTGVVTTLGGVAGASGDFTGTAATARFSGIRALAVDTGGSLYIADGYNVKFGLGASQIAISVQPLPLSVAAGSGATFSATATGGTPITYQWQKNGASISGATAATYVIPSVQASDSGSYSVVATNPLGTVTSVGAALTVLAPLPNDNFANAQGISGSTGQITGNNNGATGEPQEPTHWNASVTASSVWYRWTPTQTGTVVFDVSAGWYGLSTSLYTGSAIASLVPVANSGSSYRLTARVVAGQTYSIAVGSFNPNRGSFTLAWRTIANDDFANAQTIQGSSGSAGGSNNGATTEAFEPVMFGSTVSPGSVWFKWVPTQGGVAVFDTVGSSFDTVLGVFTGTSVSALTTVATDYNSNPTVSSYYGRSRVAFVAVPNTTYYIALASYAYASGSFVLNWQTSARPVITRQPVAVTAAAGNNIQLSVTALSDTPMSYQWYQDGTAVAGANTATWIIPNAQSSNSGNYTVVISNSAGSATSAGVAVAVLVPPPNDNFAQAQAIFGLNGSATGSNVNATAEPGEPLHWNASGTSSSVWFQWTPTTSGLAAIDTVGSNFDTVLAVYTGSALNALTRLAQDDDRGGGRTSQVSFAATSGTTYYIAIGSGTGGRGNITLNWQLSPVLAIATPPASQTVAVGGSVTFSVQATGTGVTYQWMRNGVALPGATNATLTVGNIQGGTDASYTVVVTNSSGSVTSAPATLSVAAPMLTTFTARNLRSEGGLLWSIASGNGIMVACGGGGEILSSNDNGKTWTPRNSGSTLWLVGATYGNGQFVIVGESATILTSVDGITWTPALSPGTRERINNVLYADGKWVAVGEHGIILTSLDAQTWTPRTSGVNTWLHGLAYNPKIGYWATDGEAGVILISSDAATWTALPVDGVKAYLEAVAAGDSYADFVAVGHHEITGAAVCVSIHQNQLQLKTGETVTTWSTEQNPMGQTEGLASLTSAAGALFATGTSGKIISAKDSRGPWYTIPSGTTEALLSATFANDSLYVVGGRDVILQSDTLYNSRLINISTRGQVGTGANVLISGFVITGTKSKQVLVRAAGPALGADPFNIAGVLANPVLTVLDAKGNTVATNTGWATATNVDAVSTAIAQVGAFPFSRQRADSALLLTLTPGQYTAQVSGVANSTGVAIVEVYDADPMSNTSSHAINISTRGVTSSGSNVMIAGFVVNGAASKRLLIRAVGPTLGTFGVAGAASQPQLSLFNGRGLLTATATAWGLQPNADEIRTAAKAVGAFDLPEGSQDSAMVLTLLPGAYTVQVNTVDNASGVALIEVYEVP